MPALTRGDLAGAVTVALAGGGVPVAAWRLHGWWLDSGDGVGTVTAAVFAIALLAVVARPARAWKRAAALWLGAFVASVSVLVRIGAGTIWPIVLVFAAVLLAAASVGGAAAGRAVRRSGR